MSCPDFQGLANINAGIADLSLGRTPAQGYKYLTLPSKRHIRLLNLLPPPEFKIQSPFWSDAQTIHCSIKTVGLDEKPEYDALSYTWGNPITVYENEEQAKEGAKIFVKSREIVCNGTSLTVTANLYEALIAIRRVPRAGFKAVADRSRAENIWIDAICINQNDTTERNAQVAIMDQIYSAAQMTIVWLGRDDVFTRPAAQVLQEFCKIPKDTIDLMRQHDIFQSHDIDWKFLGLRRIDSIEWLSVYAFLSRNWFRRVWILQEIALARRICILSGLVMIDWSTLASSCLHLDMSRWYGNIKQVAKFCMEGRSSSATITFCDPEGCKPRIYQAVEDFYSLINPIRTIRGIAEVRAGLGLKDRGFLMTAHRKALNLTSLVEVFRYSSSAEPKDKIYALCGLLPKNAPWAQRDAQNIVPDYNKPVEQVYLEATLFQLTWTNSLDFLGQVQDLAATRVKNLPSWVPDYSVQLSSNPVSTSYFNPITRNLARESGFSAAAGLYFSTLLSSQSSSALSLQGVLCDSIIDVGNFDNNRDLSAIMHFVSGLQHVYCRDVVDYIQKISAEQESDDISLTIEGGYLKGMRLSLVPEEARSNNDQIQSSLAAKNLIPHGSAPRIQTHVEVLWRSLIADSWEGQHPAPLEAGYAFAESLVRDLKHLFCDTIIHAAGSMSENGNTKLVKEQSEKFTALKSLAMSELNGFIRVQWSNDIPPKRICTSNIDPILAYMPSEAREKVLTRFLPDFKEANDLIIHDLNQSQVTLWDRRLAQVMAGRKLFRTKQNGFLGNGPQSLEIGDLVCVLAGGTVPYLIRPVDDTKGNRFRFIGEAYVHGIMHGEAVQAQGIEVHEIILV